MEAQRQVAHAIAPQRGSPLPATIPFEFYCRFRRWGLHRQPLGSFGRFKKWPGSTQRARRSRTFGVQVGIALGKFFSTGSIKRQVWTSSVSCGFMEELADEDLCVEARSIVPKLCESYATNVAHAAIKRVESTELLVSILDEVLHRRTRVVRERIELLAEVSRSVRQYGRSEVTLGGKEAAIQSRHLLDLVATL